MPEAPELEVVREFLDSEVVGSRVTDFQVLKPGVLRPMAGSPEDLAVRQFRARLATCPSIDSRRRRHPPAPVFRHLRGLRRAHQQPFRGEIKGVITRGRVVSGIGNAYADEVLFEAELYPFRKRTALSDEELRRLYEAARKVVRDAVDEVRVRMDGDIRLKPRDFLKVHNRGGQPCPRCGSRITQITANQRITSYCRPCQPGLLIKT